LLYFALSREVLLLPVSNLMIASLVRRRNNECGNAGECELRRKARM